MRSLVKKLSSFFVKKPESVITPVWGLIPLSEMNSDQIVRFVDEMSDSMVALSMEGFEIIYDMMPKDPIIQIRAEVNV